jgi:hypothetical protein
MPRIPEKFLDMMLPMNGSEMGKDPLKKIDMQMTKAGLSSGGILPFKPQLGKNKRGEPILKRAPGQHGPKRGKYGYVDTEGRIWIKDRAHGEYPEHWDVQKNGGKRGRTRVDFQGNILP